MSTAYPYFRVSHEKSAASGLSIESQRDICRAYYDAKRLADEGVVWYDRNDLLDKAVSARKVPFQSRPGARRLMQRVQRGDHLLFAHLDRGFREVLDFSVLMKHWMKHDIHIHFIDAQIDMRTPQGMMMANVLASMAQFQSDSASERNREIAARQKATGRPTNGMKLTGCKLVGRGSNRHWVADEDERAILHEIKKLRKEEGLSWEQVSVSIESRLRKYRGEHFSVSAFFKREWTGSRCRHALDQFEQVLVDEVQVRETIARRRAEEGALP